MAIANQRLRFNPVTGRYEYANIGGQDLMDNAFPDSSGAQSRQQSTTAGATPSSGVTPSASSGSRPTPTTVPSSGVNPSASGGATPRATAPRTAPRTTPRATPIRMAPNAGVGGFPAGQIAGIGNTAFIDPRLLVNVGEAVPEPEAGVLDTDYEALIRALTSGVNGSGGGSRLSASDKRRGYRQSQQAANQMRDYGLRAQQQYQDMLARLQENYNQQFGAGQQAIQQATEQFLGSLTPSQAYSDLPLIQLTPEQQGLAAGLQAYGAGTGEAEAVSAQQGEINRQMAELARRSASQLNTEQQRYQEALRTAGTGSQAAGLQALSQQRLLADLGAQQQYGLAGLQEALAGEKSASEMMAEAAATFGVPKKRRPKATKPPKSQKPPKK